MTRGRFDNLVGRLVEGWAWNESQPNEPVTIEVLANGRTVGQAIANRFRPDLLEAQIGTVVTRFILCCHSSFGTVRITKFEFGLQKPVLSYPDHHVSSLEGRMN